MKRFIAGFLATVMVASLFFITPFYTDAGEIPSIPESAVDPSGSPNRFYFVAMFEYNTWQKNNGSWDPVAPGSNVSGVSWPYEFTLTGRKIKHVDVIPFTNAFVNSNPAKWEKTFKESRYNQYEWSQYENRISTRFGAEMHNRSPYGTDTISFDLVLTSPSLLDAIEPERMTAPGGNIGYKFYFPMLLVIEVEPQLIVKHFTRSGQSLNSVFTDTVEEMRYGITYRKEPPSHPEYQYVGYKKSTTGEAPTGDIQSGQPPAFTYDNSFNTYFLALYYEKISESDKPNLVAVDITANGPIEVGKPASFTAKWRLDHKSLQPNQCYNVKVMEGAANLKIEQFCGTQQGQQLTMNFTYTFTSTAQKTFRLVVDSANELAETNEDDNQLLKSFKPGSEPPPPVKTFTGDFDVLPPVIDFRDPFELKPKDFVFNGCTYDGHRYKIERGGSTVYTSWATSQSQVHSYSYSTYPSIIGIGTHLITLEIRTKDCGSAETATHTLVVNGPSSNRPPEFEIGFVYPFNPTKPVHEVVEGTVMHLIYITDPTVPTPYDPDGDPIEFLGFDFSESSNWAKTIPQNYSEYGDGYHNIVMNGLGYHVVKASMRDAFGATTTRTTYIRVIPPNPIPVIDGPKEVKEGRPLPQPFSSAKSYSPAGRPINHAMDEWTNLKEVYTKPGKEIITLHVTDSIGLKSLEPAVHELTVLPDEPPVAKFEVEPRGIRGQTYYVYNKSYSPDGDKIVSVQYKMRYDDENNGFDDDPWTDMAGNMDRAAFKPNRVGKYQFYLKVCEDYGKCDDTLSDPVEMTMIDILNLAPEVSFELEGKNPMPELPVGRIYTPSEMFGWPLREINSTNVLDGKRMRWSYSKTELFGKVGKKDEKYYYHLLYTPSAVLSYNAPFSDAGYGKNSYNVYRPIAGTDPNKTFSQPLLIPNPGTGEFRPVEFTYLSAKRPEFTSSPTHIYINFRDRFYALNKSKIGRYESESVLDNYGMVKELRHHLPDGSYYDYIIGDPPIRYYTETRDYRRNNWEGIPFEFVTENEREPGVSYTQIGFEVLDHYKTDDAIFQLVKWTCACIIDKDGDRYSERGHTLFTYDLRNGEFIASGLEKGVLLENRAPEFGLSRNDNLVLWHYRYIDRYYAFISIYDRNLNRIADKEAPLFSYTPPPSQYPLTCSSEYHWDNYFEDINGNTYVYQEYNCGEVSELRDYGAIFLIKFDSDFNVVWRVKLAGNDFQPNVQEYHEISDAVVNVIGREMIVRTYQYSHASYGMVGTKVIEAVNLDSGYSRMLAPDFGYSFNNTKFDIDASGQITARTTERMPYSYTPYGIKFAWNGASVVSYTLDDTSYYSFNTGGIVDWNGSFVRSANVIYNAQYVGDGILLSIMGNPSNLYDIYSAYVWLNVGVPADRPRQGPGLTLGQLLSPTNVKDHEISFTLSLDDADADQELVGMSFRAANAANRYAVETNGSIIYLSRYVNGSRTVLAQQPFPFQDGVKVLLKLKFSGDKLELFVNGAPYFNVTDDTFKEGKFGPFSDKAYVRFGPVSTKEILPDPFFWDAEYAIWEEGSARAEIQYKNIKFNDPEGDPAAGSYQWTYVHTPMFIRNQGLSALHNKTFSEGQIVFDKVGLYEVRLSAKDDPHPEYRYPSKVFDEYRESSNVFGKRIIVHRRPVARFTLSLNSDKTVRFDDTSYDPDRWASASEFSPPEDGKNYQTTRGIFERKYYYITPSGTIYMEKLVVPRETGTYTVGMAVKDEYGAWSDYYEQVITIHELPAPNEPPHAGFTVNPATTYRGVAVTINSTAWDKEDGDRTKLPHEYYISNVNGGSESLASASRTSWTKTFNTVGTFRIRQVVWDSLGQTDQAIQTVTVLNRKPQANVTTPASADSAKPTKFDVLRPTFAWTYADADGDAQTQYQVQIYRMNGTLERDTGARSGTGKTWAPTVDLPERVTMYIRVRVHDGYEWSEWSAPKYFYIETNRPPVADFDWTPKPVYEGDTITLIDRSTDPDGDPLTYQWSVSGPNGYTRSGSDQTFVIPGSDTENRTGTYNVTLTVRDPKGASSSLTKSITVLPLGITGYVEHTERWNENRISYNQKHSGTDDSPRPYEYFWAGERFILKADTTETGTETKAEEVTVRMIPFNSIYSYYETLDPTNPSRTKWQGEMYEEGEFDYLPDGETNFEFTVCYSNGVVKQDVVTVVIDGDWTEYFRIHRVK
jgi:hypothetical protein